MRSYIADLFTGDESFLQKESKPSKDKPCVNLLGFDGAGKTTLLNRWLDKKPLPITPGEGFNTRDVSLNNVTMSVRDFGGCPKTRYMWSVYTTTAEGIIFVVSLQDRERLMELQDEIETLAKNERLKDVPILILANKTDVLSPRPISMYDLGRRLDLKTVMEGHQWKIMPVSATNGAGIDEAMEWFTTVLRENRRTQRAARKGHERSKSNV